MSDQAVDLFLLIPNLSQLRDRDKVISLFIEAMNQIFPGLGFRWSREPGDAASCLEVCSRNGSFGYVSHGGDAGLDAVSFALIHNSCQLLAVLLERLQQERALLDHNRFLEEQVAERTSHLEASRAELLAITAIIPVAILRFDRDKVCRFANPAVHRLTGWTPEDCVGQAVVALAGDHRRPDRLVALVDRVLADGKPCVADLESRRNGRMLIHAWTLVPETGPDGAVSSVLGIAHDITERKQAESDLKDYNQKIAKTLREKEVLISELFHRTKNTLQLIHGILTLGLGGQPADSALGQLVATTGRRIQAIALVHEMLYKTRDLSRIPIREYLENLSGLLLSGFGTNPGRIRLDVQAEDLTFMIDTAIPFGIIFNELMTNSLKYAFPGDRAGTISVSLAKTGRNTILFTYRDDGVGVPADFDFRGGDSLGLRLVYSIGGDQLQGEVVMEGGAGVGCSIEFPPSLYLPRV
jgi:PAS domain S-box-containing protein